MRTDQRYFEDVRRVLCEFYRPGDELRLVRCCLQPSKCQMCGGIVDITTCYELLNLRSGRAIVCGRKCIIRYAEVVAETGQVSRITFPPEYRDQAALINRQRPHTVVVEHEQWTDDCWGPHDLIGQRRGADDPAYEDALADGLDPDEIDWESHDYE